MRQIVGLGETLLDVIFRQDQPTGAVPGGSTFNSMVSLGRVASRTFPEVRTLMVSSIGDDHIGDIICSFMQKNHLDTGNVLRQSGVKTPVSMAFLNEKNDAQYEIFRDPAERALTEADVPDLGFQKSDMVLFGSYFAINPAIRSFTKGLIQAAHDAGAIIYYDINFRKGLLDRLPEIKPLIEENCRLSDFVRGSKEDFGYLYGCFDPEEIYEKHVSPLCKNFIYTRGAEPLHVFTPELHETFAVPQVKTVSTIGAGDNFNAGFVYGMLKEGILKEQVKGLGLEDWGRLTAVASKFSSSVCQSPFNYVDDDFEV